MSVIDDIVKVQGVFILELIHLDPMVNLALNYAFASDLVCMTSNSSTNPKYKLTDKGHKFANKIIQDGPSSLAKEKEILEKIGQKITEVKLTRELL